MIVILIKITVQNMLKWIEILQLYLERISMFSRFHNVVNSADLDFIRYDVTDLC